MAKDYSTMEDSNRGTDKQPGTTAVNPRANNTMGNIIRWKETGDFAGTTFAWNHFVLAGDPSLERADAKGNNMSTSNMGKGDLRNMGNNAMLAADTRTGEVRRFLVGPSSCESPSERSDPAAVLRPHLEKLLRY